MQKQIDEVMGLVEKYGHHVVKLNEAKSNADIANALAVTDETMNLIESKLRELLPVWQPIESAEKPAIGENCFGERILLLVDCGDRTLKSTKIGWWCDKWMMDTGGSVKQNGYRVVGWMPLPKAPE